MQTTCVKRWRQELISWFAFLHKRGSNNDLFIDKAFILPLFDYWDIAWSNVLQQEVDRRQRLQTRSVRIITRCSRSPEAIEQQHWPTLFWKYCLLLFLFKGLTHHRICSGELGQMVARPLCMREVPISIPGFSKTKIFINDYSLQIRTKRTVPGGLEPLTFWLTAERANRLRHGNFHEGKLYNFYQI